MTLPWFPVVLTDAAGSLCVLVLALACLATSLQWYRRRLWDLFRHYLFFFTLALVVFAVSRSGGHLVKQVLLATGNDAVWHDISPFTGAMNTATFIIVFAISMYARRIGLAHREITSYQHDLERLVEKRTRLLDQQLAFQKQLLDAVPIPVFFTDAAGRLLGANPSFLAMFGCGDSVFGRHPRDIRELRPCAGFLDPGGDGGVAQKEESVTCNGVRRDLILHARPFSGDDGALAGHIGAIIDITSRRRLESFVLQSEKMETVATMAGGIAHEFNNILAAIMGFAELAALKLPAGHEVGHDLDRILESSRRARDLVRQIMVFSRHRDVSRQPCDISAIIARAASLLRHRAGDGIEIRTDLCGKGVVMADPGQMQQVFLNLGDNGIRAMEGKGGVLHMGCGPVEFPDRAIPGSEQMEPGRYVRIRVSDQGVGMEEAVVRRIFDPFFSTRDVSAASGLGLSVVHGIIRKHGGMVQVDSVPGRGTTFEIFLPVVHTAPRDLPVPERVATPAPARDGVVLLVEDERPVADMLAAMLGRLGYGTEVFHDPRQALDRFRERPETFVLALLDEVMPAMRGTDLARRLREKRPDLPVVVCSGYSGGGAALPEGVDAWLDKPVSATDLERTLDGLLSRSSGGVSVPL